MRAVICIPTITRPYQATLDALAAASAVLQEAGWEDMVVHEIGSPYISHARAKLLRKALDAKADVIVFLDHDVSFDPQDLLRLVTAQGDYVVGTYRFKKEPEEYMGALLAGDSGRPIVREDGALRTVSAPAGFMKITPKTVNRMMQKHPELCFGERHTPHFDFFNHGAQGHVWIGEDYAACKRWIDDGGEIWTIPDMNINHHAGDGTVYRGNLHEYLLRQPGGSKWSGECPTG